jgi:protein ImuA
MSLSILPVSGPPARGMVPMPGGAAAGIGLARGRVHEFRGPSRVALAVQVMGECAGPVLWITPGWQAERLYPAGVADYADPARLICARARRPEDILWAMEEGLRSGAVPLVVAEMPGAPGLTPVRRLQLAAEAGAEAAHHAGRGIVPLGVMLTGGEVVAAGAESRWRMGPLPSGSTLLEERGPVWRLERERARGAAPAAWVLRREAGGAVLERAGGEI